MDLTHFGIWGLVAIGAGWAAKAALTYVGWRWFKARRRLQTRNDA